MPGWSLDLAREDRLTGCPWDFSRQVMRERVRQLESKALLKLRLMTNYQQAA